MIARIRNKVVVGLFVMSLALLAGCSSSQTINDISVGMTKQEVIRALGAPVSSSATGMQETLRYRLYGGVTANPWYQEYYVNLLGGRVVAYGQ